MPQSAVFKRWSRFLAIPLILASLCTSPAGAAAEVLKLGFILSPQSQLGRGASDFAAVIKDRTAGRYAVELFPDAMLGGEVAMLKSLQLGTIDLAFITGASVATVVPEAGVFNIPFLFHDITDARALLDGPLGDEYRRKFDAIGITALAWGENGMRELTTTKRLVRTPADLVGLKLRLPQSDVMSAGFKALGADVQQLAFPDLYAALQSGRVEGQENPVATILSSQFARVQTTLTMTDHVYDPAVILMSKERFDELSGGDRAIFREAAVMGAATSRRVTTEAVRSGIAALRAAGMTVITDVDRAAFASKCAAAAPYFEGRFGRALIERIRAFRAPRPSGEATAGALPRP